MAHRQIQLYTSDHPTKARQISKANYYSSPSTPWIVLICFVVLSLLVIPLAFLETGDKGVLFLIYGLYIAVALFVLLISYVINPLNVSHRQKKNHMMVDVLIMDDSIEMAFRTDKKTSPNPAEEPIRFTMFFSSLVKAYHDKYGFYFVYRNEKKRKVCMIVDDDGLLSDDARRYLLKQVSEKRYLK